MKKTSKRSKRHNAPILCVVCFLTIFQIQGGLDANLKAQTENLEWSALMQRDEGWLGADGIYSIRLRFDAASNSLDNGEENYLWLFSDTICGSTRDNGTEYGEIYMVNHSFALLKGDSPNSTSMKFLWEKPDSARSSVSTPSRNIIDGHYWLQDGVRFKDTIWLTAILVGKAWKPARIDAVEIPLAPTTRVPEFDKIRVDKSANLSYQTEDAQIVLGAAICDDSEDDYLYIFGYVDRFREYSRKDAVVARVHRDKLPSYSNWQFYQGAGEWSNEISSLLDPKAALVSNVSTEYSVSKIPYGREQGKWLLVYTPGVISDKVAFRVGDSPIGPFGDEHVFYQSEIPRQIPGVRCYNAKAHPAFATEDGILVSYNVNRLGSLAKRPEEYRPRFITLHWKMIEDAEASRLEQGRQ